MGLKETFLLESMSTDYHEMGSGYIFKISEYWRAKKLFGIDMPIRVINITTGECVGTTTAEDILAMR